MVCSAQEACGQQPALARWPAPARSSVVALFVPRIAALLPRGPPPSPPSLLPQSNDRLDLVRSQAELVLRVPDAANGAPGVGGPAAAPGAAGGKLEEVQLRALLADLISELAAKYQQVNELKTHSFLSAAAMGGGGGGGGGAAPGGQRLQAAQALSAQVLAAGGEGMKSLLGRFVGPAAAGQHQQQLAGGQASAAQQPPPAQAQGLLGGFGARLVPDGVGGLGGLLGRRGGEQQQPPQQPPGGQHDLI
jgi:hypothetical protein